MYKEGYMTMNKWKDNEIDLAKKKFPCKAELLDVVSTCYDVMDADGHSGMSWSLTRNLVEQIVKKMTQDIFDNQDKSKWLSDVINTKLENENSKKSDRWDDYIAMVYQSAEKTVNMMLSMAKSYDDLVYISDVFNRLAKGNNLLPIDDVPEVWETSIDASQCIRKTSLFKHVYSDGTVKYHDVDRAYCKEQVKKPDGEIHTSTYHSWFTNIVDVLYPITFPYMPSKNAYVVNMVRFYYKGSLEYALIDSIDTPDGEHREIKLAYKEVELAESSDESKRSDWVSIKYDVFCKARDEHDGNV